MTLSFTLLIALACSGSAGTPDPEPAAARTQAPTDVTVAELVTALGAGQVPLLLDVRTPDEFSAGHVANAVNVPVSELAGRLDELAEHRQDPIYVICHSGGRSARAAALLRDAGFEAPINVLGGTQAWIDAGHPVQ